MRSLYKYAFLLVTLAVAAVYVSRNWSSFQTVSIIRPWLLPVMLLVVLLWQLIVALNTRAVLSIKKLSLSVHEAAALAVSSSFYNLVTPASGGVALRALYLKRKYSFSYTDFITTLAASYVLVFLASGLTGLLSVLLLYSSLHVFNGAVFAVFLCTFLGAAAMVMFAPVFPAAKNRWLNKLSQLANSWHLLRTNRKLVLTIVGFSVAQLLTMALLVFLEFQVIGVSLSLPAALLLASMSVLGVIINITPGGIGISEAITVFTALALGISPAQSLSAALLGRLVILVVLFIGGPISGWYLLRSQGIKKKDLRDSHVKRS